MHTHTYLHITILLSALHTSTGDELEIKVSMLRWMERTDLHPLARVIRLWGLERQE